ncbi:hypothetical protein ABT099_23830 [Streptomyces prasinus]|uniref:hypothetical protein n=1 Tax=Streptomyces prasinus TaxID=67345 RepID=UPI003318335F
MLRVVYQAATNLEAGRLVDVVETRGQVTVRLRRGTRASDFITPLNEALAGLISRGTWFQIWRGQIVSAGTPDSPLLVQYEADPEVDPLACVHIRERRGMVRFHVSPDVRAEDLTRAVNPALRALLAGGQWFQLWQGEIVTMEGPGAQAA